MNTWKYHGITSQFLTFLNPLNTSRLDEVIGILNLPEGASVLDIACGKAEPLLRIAERYQVHGIGVDISQFFIDAAVQEARKRVSAPSTVELLVMDGKEYSAEAASFDLTICLGASWVYDGLAGTLERLAQLTRSQGMILVGEPYWRCQPSQEYLDQVGELASSFTTHAGNVQSGVDAGLVPVYSVVSSQDDWDRYEWSRIRAGEIYCLQHPDDPDVGEIRARVAKVRDSFLRYGGREYVGWAAYLFLKP